MVFTRTTYSMIRRMKMISLWDVAYVARFLQVQRLVYKHVISINLEAMNKLNAKVLMSESLRFIYADIMKKSIISKDYWLRT